MVLRRIQGAIQIVPDGKELGQQRCTAAGLRFRRFTLHALPVVLKLRPQTQQLVHMIVTFCFRLLQFRLFPVLVLRLRLRLRRTRLIRLLARIILDQFFFTILDIYAFLIATHQTLLSTCLDTDRMPTRAPPSARRAAGLKYPRPAGDLPGVLTEPVSSSQLRMIPLCGGFSPNIHRDPLGLCLLNLGHFHFQNTILIPGHDLIRVHALGKRKAPAEAAVAPLYAIVLLFVNLLFEAPFATDGEDVILYFQVDVLRFNTGNFRPELNSLLRLYNVHGWHPRLALRHLTTASTR